MGAEKNVSFPWQVIAMDLLGPPLWSTSGYQYSIVVSDWFTKFSLLYPLGQATAPSIARFLEKDVFLTNGFPQYIICDNGHEFVSKCIQSLVEQYDSHFWYTAYYHAQTNFVERANRTICTAIRSYINGNHEHWDKEMLKIGYALRTAVHDVTGYAPSFLNFGRVVPVSGKYYENPSNPDLRSGDREVWTENVGKLSELVQEVQSMIYKAHERNAKYYNLRRRDL
ncbi:hypothetical protein JTB14_033351 [Gonioctena quinquepunctata]|nr:hypothetical protein JTB14_033351 [Gonioctena quinquepunctata]